MEIVGNHRLNKIQWNCTYIYESIGIRRNQFELIGIRNHMFEFNSYSAHLLNFEPRALLTLISFCPSNFDFAENAQ